MKKIEFYENNAGGLYVAVTEDDVIIYTACGFEDGDTHPSDYISLDGDEDCWERGGWADNGLDDMPDNDDAYSEMQHCELIAEYIVEDEVINATINYRAAGNAGMRFLGL
jgi:hypothetical protein